MFSRTRLVLSIPDSPIEKQAFRSRSFRKLVLTLCIACLVIFSIHNLVTASTLQRGLLTQESIWVTSRARHQLWDAQKALLKVSKRLQRDSPCGGRAIDLQTSPCADRVSASDRGLQIQWSSGKRTQQSCGAPSTGTSRGHSHILRRGNRRRQACWLGG